MRVVVGPNEYRNRSMVADHGNAEKMIAPDGGKHTAHTCYKVRYEYGRARIL